MEQILAILVPQITKDIATRSQHAPAERVQMTTADRDQPGDQVRRDSAAVHRQGCPSACCDATTGFSPPFPRIQEQIVEVAKIIPQRRISERIVVKTTDVPVPQILTEVAEVVKAVNTAPQDRDEPFPPLKEEIHEVIKLPPMERILERTAEHIVQVPVPQTLKQVAEVVKAVPQERIPEKTGEQTTGPSDTDDFEDCESPAGAVHRRRSGRACCDVATGPSVSNCVEDSGSPEERILERIVEHTRDVLVPQIHELIVEYVTIIPQERFSERTAEQTVDVPTPQILEEIAEAVSAPHERVQQRTVEHVATVKNVLQERISGKIGEPIDDDTVPVDQPGDQVRRDPQACGVATTGPSASNCGEDVGSLARAVRQQSRESTCDHADQPGDQARLSLTDSAHEQGASGANGRGPANGVRRPNMKHCSRSKPSSGYGHRC